ncbi:MAG: hypothetical protein HY560_05055 [Gemmatimonadetes bacterium]|nr:hypothetical protein [Gemmatimonadota bacterium]
MARMIRKQIYLRQDQQRRLKQLAKALGLSQAELIRKSLDQAMAPGEESARDRASWEAERRFVRERLAKGPLAWPANYFDQVVGAWRGEPLERPPQGSYEIRDRQ